MGEGAFVFASAAVADVRGVSTLETAGVGAPVALVFSGAGGARWFVGANAGIPTPVSASGTYACGEKAGCC